MRLSHQAGYNLPIVPESEGHRGALIAALAVIVVLVAAALWLPRWWDNRLYRQVEAVVGVGARVLPGSVTKARQSVDPGKQENAVLAVIGKPSIAIQTEGTSRHAIWTYYYADGTMTLNLTDGRVVRAGIAYGPPRIPTSARPP
jgi:flagellar basal body-associated protein FliL